MRLRRGHILLMAGGAIVAFSFIASNYYASQFLKEIQEKNMRAIAPGAKLDLQENITSGRGAYVVAFLNHSAVPVKAAITITGPDGKSVLGRNSIPLISTELFAAQKQGNYTLIISNLGNTTLEASVIFGEEEIVTEVISMPNAISTAISTLLLVAGIIIIVAGGTVLFLDRRREQRMRQFGDMSDLV